MARPAKHTKTAAVKAVKDAAAEAKATAVKAQEKVVAEVKEVAKTAAKTTTRKTCKTSVCVEKRCSCRYSVRSKGCCESTGTGSF